MSIEIALEQGAGIIATARYRSLRNQLARAVNQGHLVRLCPGVLGAREIADQPEVRSRAALTWKPGHILMGPAAARVTFWPECPVGSVDIAGPQTHLQPPGVRVHQLMVPTELRAGWGGGIVTVPELTVLDMAVMGRWDGLCEALRRKAVSLASLSVAAELVGRRRGAESRRECLLRAAGNPWSVPEMELHLLYRGAGILGWVGNRAIRLNGRIRIPDVAFETAPVLAEVDSRLHHTRVNDFVADQVRGNWFAADGWSLLRFAPETIREHPNEVIEQTLATLASRRGDSVPSYPAP